MLRRVSNGTWRIDDVSVMHPDHAKYLPFDVDLMKLLFLKPKEFPKNLLRSMITMCETYLDRPTHPRVYFYLDMVLREDIPDNYIILFVLKLFTCFAPVQAVFVAQSNCELLKQFLMLATMQIDKLLVSNMERCNAIAYVHFTIRSLRDALFTYNVVQMHDAWRIYYHQVVAEIDLTRVNDEEIIPELEITSADVQKYCRSNILKTALFEPEEPNDGLKSLKLTDRRPEIDKQHEATIPTQIHKFIPLTAHPTKHVRLLTHEQYIKFMEAWEYRHMTKLSKEPTAPKLMKQKKKIATKISKR
jgi:hypothetical protein